jgi:uncharacterized protein (UPF0548 family)
VRTTRTARARRCGRGRSRAGRFVGHTRPVTEDFSYHPVGATRDGTQPPGFRRLRVRGRVGTGPDAFAAAADAVLTWRMHRAMGVRMETGAEGAAPGAGVVVGLGVGPLRLRAPCRVVWTVRDERRAGWAYGTLHGHPVAGEEAFVVEREEDGGVWLTVSAFSRPVTRWTRAAGPLLPVAQRLYGLRCVQVLRGLVRHGPTAPHGR